MRDADIIDIAFGAFIGAIVLGLLAFIGVQTYWALNPLPADVQLEECTSHLERVRRAAR